MESLDRDFTGNSAGKRHSFHKGPRKRWCFHIVSENQPNNNNDNSNNNDNNNSNNNNSNNHDDDDDNDDDDEHHFFSDGFNMFLETADGFNITWHRGYIVVVLYIYIWLPIWVSKHKAKMLERKDRGRRISSLGASLDGLLI